MLIVGKNGTVQGLNGASPPLPFIEVEDAEAQTLIDRGYAIAYVGDDAPEIAVDPVIEPVIEPVVDPVVDPVIEPIVEPVAEPAPVNEPLFGETEVAAGDAEEALKLEIISALDLLDEDDFVKTGERAGKPKVSAINAILGYDVTAGDVDAAIGPDTE